jgi:hypothetical protein
MIIYDYMIFYYNIKFTYDLPNDNHNFFYKP